MTAKAAQDAHTTEETFSHVITGLIFRDQMVPCDIRCGKQLPQDQKGLTFVGVQGKITVDLISNCLEVVTFDGAKKLEVTYRWTQQWNYEQLITKIWARLTASCRSKPPWRPGKSWI